MDADAEADELRTAKFKLNATDIVRESAAASFSGASFTREAVHEWRRLQLLARPGPEGVGEWDAEVGPAQLVRESLDQLGTDVSEQFGTHPQLADAVAVGEAPVAHRDHDRQGLDAGFDQ